MNEKKNKIQEVSKKYSIPISTIRDKVAGKHSKAVDASTLLSPEDKNQVIKTSRRGYPVTRTDVFEVAKQITDITEGKAGT